MRLVYDKCLVVGKFKYEKKASLFTGLHHPLNLKIIGGVLTAF